MVIGRPVGSDAGVPAPQAHGGRIRSLLTAPLADGSGGDRAFRYLFLHTFT